MREANRRLAEAGAELGDADLREMLGVLGLGELEALETHGDLTAIDPQAAGLLEQREAARARRDFAEADRLRAEIEAAGWDVRDGPAGPELVPRAP